MQGLLGKITSVDFLDDGGGARVSFKAEAVLPARTSIPEWLKDQTLTVTRRFVDRREAGRAGDGISLSAPDSARWLAPLTVTPSTVKGKAPSSLDVWLAWWKDENPPECTVTAGGRSTSVKLTSTGDGAFAGTIDLAEIGSITPPIAIEVECGGARAVCTVFGGKPAAVKSISNGRQLMTVANDWYRVDLATQTNAGGIASLVESGRGLDHFAPPANVIQPPLEYGGQYEHTKIGFGWYDEVFKIATDVIGSRREGDAVRVSMDAVYDEGRNIHTDVQYTVFDRLPIVLMQREFSRRKPKDDKPEGKEPVDSIDSFLYSCRSATVAERGGVDGSRVFASEAGRLHCVRPGGVLRGNTLREMQLVDGWMLVEHPGRRSYMLHLTDRTEPPTFVTWRGWHEITVEPTWPHTVLAVGKSIGLSTAVAAGEIGGVDGRGAWVACRSRVRDGVQQVAVVGRFVDDAAVPAVITLGGESRSVTLMPMYLPGVGTCHAAVAAFDGVSSSEVEPAVEVEGIPSR